MFVSYDHGIDHGIDNPIHSENLISVSVQYSIYCYLILETLFQLEYNINPQS